MQFNEVVIAGGGPAGAYCALELARKGIYATICDNTHPREKPCGGAILPPVLEKFPILDKFRSRSGSLADLRIVSTTNKQVTTNRFKTGFTVSRRIFDQGIINMATKNGAKLIEERITGIEKKRKCWKIRTDKRILSTKILVGADGVNSLVRRKTVGAISNDNLALTYGYMATGVEKERAVIKFPGGITGYIWIFPRHDHSSIGIGSELEHGRMLKKLLDNFIESYCPKIKIISRFAAMLPSAKNPKFFDLPCAGKDWILVGDAAGHVDPISGDGILYALWSGKLAAEAIEKNDLRSYDTAWRQQYGNYLGERCKYRDVFYNPFSIEISLMHRSFFQ